MIVEKPIEITLERADALIRACDENRVRLCTIFPYRFTEGASALKAAIAQGRFGRITVGDAYNKWWRTQSYYDSGAWRGTWKLDGGGACHEPGHPRRGPDPVVSRAGRESVFGLRRSAWRMSASRSRTPPWPPCGTAAARWA